MKKIAITGNIGSGKTWVCALFERMGIPVFYSDTEAKKLYDIPKIKSQITQRLGDACYDQHGQLNRAYLAQLIFQNDEARRFVERTLYPALTNWFTEWCDQQNAPYVLFESALVFEKHLEGLFDAVIMVSAPESTRIHRVMRRDRCDENAIRSRIQRQWPEEKKIIRSQYIIRHDNDDDEAKLLQQVRHIDACIRSDI
ncbi:MAG: dephospho-CoA kinase [Candidatus Limimorpha sp.]